MILNKKIDEIKDKVKEFPTTPGVYLMKKESSKVIYVGKAKNLRARVRSYFTNSKDHSVKTVHLVNHIDHVDYILTKTEVEAFLLEASLIKKYKPRYNIRLKDDKSYPYIRCSFQDSYPRFYLSRKVRNDGALYFGPYTSGGDVRGTIKFLNRTFKIRDCSDSYMKGRTRPCMTYQIDRCTAPCVDFVSQKEYSEDVDSALSFLKGRNKKIIKTLEKRMFSAADEERFEAAAKLRDSIKSIKAIWEKQNVISTNERDQDIVAYFGDKAGTLIEVLHLRAGRVIGNRFQYFARLNVQEESENPQEWLTSFLNQYYSENVVPDEIILSEDLGGDIYNLLGEVFKERQGRIPKFIHALGREEKKLMDMAYKNAESHFKAQVNKRKSVMFALETIQQKLKLPELPIRIECYDISNFQGDQSVASQVVFEDGVPKKEDYRRYKIKTVDGPNDFASMKEVLSRRFKHTEYDTPNLVVVDGGKGQLKMACEVLKDIGISGVPVVGLAKARVKGEFSDQEISGTEERFFLPGRQNPVTFAKGSEALHILAGIRDEAHRFAITYHRKLRENDSLQSILELVNGLGPKRQKTLLKHFGSVEDIRKASVEEIAELPSMNRVLAERVLLQLEDLL